MTVLLVVTLVIVTALAFDFTNGFHDSANAMAASVATGALAPRRAVLLAAILNVIGAFMSTEVAKTISSGMVDDRLVTPPMVFAGLAGAILWNLLTWLVGLPSSSSHAMFGGLIGAVLVSAGWNSINGSVIVSKILLPALVAPLVASVTAYAATRLAIRIMRHREEGASPFFRRAQVFSSSLLALAHGTSDGQKTMGIITLVLVTSGYQQSGTPPYLWVILAAGLAIGVGTYSGGWRIMRTMGRGVADIQPAQGFAAETSSMVAILSSAHFGFGLSTTHVAAGSILGAGLGRRAGGVRWPTAGRMGLAWLLTLPAAGVIGGLSALVILQGLWGLVVISVLLLLSVIALIRIARHNHVNYANVNDHHEVRVITRPAPVAAGRAG